MKLRPHHLLLLLAVSLFRFTPLDAAGQSPSERISEQLSHADTSGAAPEANAIILESSERVEYKSSGSYEETVASRIRILTDKGREKFGQVSFDYHRRYGRVEIKTARILKADGTTVEVPEDNFTDVSSSATADMNIYEPDFRERIITFPNLELGDTIEYEVKYKYKPLIKKHFNMEFFFSSLEPIRHKKVVIIGPKSRPLNYVVRNGKLDFTQTKKGGKNIYEWEIRDAEKIVPEPGMISLSGVATRLVVNTQRSWKELSRYAYSLMEDKLKADKSVKRKAAEITSGMTTDEEKLRAVHYFIAKNIRYLGVAMDRKAFVEPHKASYTLERGCGVCRDKAVLMASMLHELGIESYIVLVNVYRTTVEEIPSLFFEHAIVAVRKADGSLMYVDPTDEFSAGVKATYAGGKPVLICSKEGFDLTHVPFVPAEENLGTIRASSRVNEDGSVTGTVSVSGTGIYDEMLRGLASRTVKSELEMLWETLLQDVYPGAELTSLELGEPTRLQEPMYMKFSYRIEDYVLDLGEYLLLKAPLAGGDLELVSRSIERVTDLPERKYDLFVGATIGFDEQETVELPAGYEVKSTPDPVYSNSDPFELEIEYKPVPDGQGSTHPKITYARRFLINASVLSPADYLDLKRLIKAISRSRKGEIVLERKER